ncbi:hypothetical protein HRbin29_01445 [bacterium HR29]|nr:hypothetical protein HRbin29_01445 [bacterium HR29]
MKAFKGGFFGCFGVAAAILLVVVVAAAIASLGDDEPEIVSMPTAVDTGASVATRTDETSSASPTTPPASGSLGSSRENPAPRGAAVRLRDWIVRVEDVIPDATQMVLAENMFNTPPPPGRQYLIVRLTLQYEGEDETAIPAFDLSFSLFGDRRVEYTTYEEWCGVIPSELDTWKELMKGGEITGNLCWSVPTDEVESLALRVKDGLVSPVIGWFSLR